VAQKRKSYSRLADAEFAALLGDACLVWNFLEDSVKYILPKYMNAQEAYAVVSVLGNQTKIDFIMHVVRSKEKDQEFLARMEYFAKAFSICRENRNILLHSILITKPPTAHLKKPSKSSPGKYVKYKYDSDVVKRAIDDMNAVWVFLGKLMVLIYTRTIEDLSEELRHRVKPWARHQPLPDIPPLPRKIAPLPPEVPRAETPPP
jgi:hypothetical protein